MPAFYPAGLEDGSGMPGMVRCDCGLLGRRAADQNSLRNEHLGPFSMKFSNARVRNLRIDEAHHAVVSNGSRHHGV
jgi:hypothetical protein